MESTKKQLEQKIQKGELKMRPKLYFVFQIILISLISVLLFVLVLFLTSLISFILNKSGLGFLVKFGVGGVRMLFLSFPWVIVLIMVPLVILLWGLIRKHTSVYKKPLIYSILIMITLIVISGAFLAKAPLHQRISDRIEEGHFPAAKPLYRGVRRPEAMYSGLVTEITKNGFKVKDSDKGILNVVVSGETRLPGNYLVEKGDQVVIMGKLEEKTIYADGIHELSFRPLPLKPKRMK